jgi:hypothetical protein
MSTLQSVHSQSSPNTVNVNDSLLPNLLIKVATYTATIDHADFMIRRKFNTGDISSALPEIERKVKGFKSRLERKGNQMNLRSLNTGVIMLKEISDNLASYKKMLTDYSTELSQSNVEVKKILRDPAIHSLVSDSILMEQLEDIRVEGAGLDSLQMKTISKVNLMQNRVAVNLLESTDIISDMRYLTIAFKIGMWSKEEPPLLKAGDYEYQRGLGEITKLGLTRAWKVITIYLNEKWNVVIIGLLIFVSIFHVDLDEYEAN